MHDEMFRNANADRTACKQGRRQLTGCLALEHSGWQGVIGLCKRRLRVAVCVAYVMGRASPPSLTKSSSLPRCFLPTTRNSPRGQNLALCSRNIEPSFCSLVHYTGSDTFYCVSYHFYHQTFVDRRFTFPRPSFRLVIDRLTVLAGLPSAQPRLAAALKPLLSRFIRKHPSARRSLGD